MFTSPLAEQLAPDALDRFLRYVRVDTQSQRDADGTPSTPGQFDLARMLVDELREMGLADAEVDEHCYVFATLPATVENAPVVGLIAHMDVSPDAPGAGVEPIVHERYAGGPIELPRNGTVIDPAASAHLQGKEGEDIVTSSGDTLLGADDKAGVAEIMAAVRHLAAHPELPRPTIRVAFTPDEELGQGPLLFDLERFGAVAAYTMDGSTLGELQDETFTGSLVTVCIKGVDVHPGFATGKLVNAAKIAAKILARLPEDGRAPETTAGRDGFIHPYEVTASAGEARITAIARDFDDDRRDAHAALLTGIAEEVVAEHPGATLEVEVKEQYPNMRRHLEPFPEIVAHAEAAIVGEGLEPLRNPIRGGTDGSILSARGLPTPNIFAGGHEFHSVREWVSVQDMAAAAAVIVRLAEHWAASGEAGDRDGAGGQHQPA